MELKTIATTAYLVIESLTQLLEREGVDISSIKFRLKNEEDEFKSPEIMFEKMIDLSLKELEKIKDGVGVQAAEWIDVNKLTPQYDIKVLVSFGDDCQPEFDHLITDADENDVFADYGDEVTHWMPLPKLPHETQEQSHE